MVPMTGRGAGGLPPRDAALLARITGPVPVAGLLKSRLEIAALDRLVARGLVMLAGVTPSDASHVLGRLDQQGWPVASRPGTGDQAEQESKG